MKTQNMELDLAEAHKMQAPTSSVVTQIGDDNKLWGWGCSFHDNKLALAVSPTNQHLQ